MPAVRVLIADDHPLILVGLATALEPLGIEVVDTVDTASRVIEKYEQVKPDVLVLDIRFGEGPTGLEVARQLLQKHPKARIVFYSQFDQNETIQEGYRLGGMAFIPKHTAPALLAEAIRQAATGQPFFLHDIANRLAMTVVRGDDSPRTRLEPRELAVFKLMAEGLTIVEIAERMDLSAKTISTVSQTVKEKLGVQRPAEVTRLALRHGLIEP